MRQVVPLVLELLPSEKGCLRELLYGLVPGAEEWELRAGPDIEGVISDFRLDSMDSFNVSMVMRDHLFKYAS